MTATELLENVPEPLRPAVAKYAPALAAMSAEELWAWIELLVMGRTREAMDSLAARLADDELLAAMTANEKMWTLPIASRIMLLAKGATDDKASGTERKRKQQGKQWETCIFLYPVFYAGTEQGR